MTIFTHIYKLLAIFFITLFFIINNPRPLQASPAHQYIQTYREVAIKEMQVTGIPASIKLAQGMFESSFGKSELAVKGNNHFGIKCKKEWTGEKIYFTDDAPNECFRKYDHPLTSYQDHSNILTERKRYHFLFDLDITDYKAWANGLKKAGYATNPQYAHKLIGLIEKFDLQYLDNNLPMPSPILAHAQMPNNFASQQTTEKNSLITNSNASIFADEQLAYDQSTVPSNNLQQIESMIAKNYSNTGQAQQKQSYFMPKTKGRNKSDSPLILTPEPTQSAPANLTVSTTTAIAAQSRPNPNSYREIRIESQARASTQTVQTIATTPDLVKKFNDVTHSQKRVFSPKKQITKVSWSPKEQPTNDNITKNKKNNNKENTSITNTNNAQKNNSSGQDKPKRLTRKKVATNNKVNTVIYEQAVYPLDIAKLYDIHIHDLLEFNDLNSKETEIPSYTYIYLDNKKTKNNDSQKFHVVANQDNMWSIAQRYGIQLAKLYERNQMRTGMQPMIGEKIFLKGKTDYPPKIKRPKRKRKTFKTEYEYRRGDPARTHFAQKKSETPAKKVRQTKNLTNKYQSFALQETSHQQEENTNDWTADLGLVGSPAPTHYIVKLNESLFAIAQKHNMSISELIMLNNLNSSKLRAGQRLLVY